MPWLMTRENTVPPSVDVYSQMAMDLESFRGARRSTGNHIIHQEKCRASLMLRLASMLIGLGCVGWIIQLNVIFDQQILIIVTTVLFSIMSLIQIIMVIPKSSAGNTVSELMLLTAFFPDMMFSLSVWWSTYAYWIVNLPIYQFWIVMYNEFSADFGAALAHYQIEVAFVCISVAAKIIALWAVMRVKYKYSESPIGDFLCILLVSLLLGLTAATVFGFTVPLVARSYLVVFALQNLIGWIGVGLTTFILLNFLVGSGRAFRVLSVLIFIGMAIFMALVTASLLLGTPYLTITANIPENLQLYFVIMVSVLAIGSFLTMLGAMMGFPRHYISMRV